MIVRSAPPLAGLAHRILVCVTESAETMPPESKNLQKVLSCTKLLPDIATGVPPVAGPLRGATFTIVGTAAGCPPLHDMGRRNAAPRTNRPQ